MNQNKLTLTNPPLFGHNPLCVHNQSREGLCMKGIIRTKEKCPECGEKFIEYPSEAMACPACLIAGKMVFPKNFYIDLYWKSKQRKIYNDSDGRKLNSYQLAFRVLIEIRQKIDRRQFDPADYKGKNITALKFDNYCQKFLKDEYEFKLHHGELAPATVDNMRIYINKYFIPFFKARDIRDIDTGDIDDFQKQLPADHKKSYRRLLLSNLHAIFSWAKWRRDIKSIPDFPRIKRKAEDNINWIDESTQGRVYQHIPEKHKPIFLFMFRQGCRPGEARALQWEDIDFENRKVIIRRTFSRHEYHPRTKTGQNRPVPLFDDVYKMLCQIRGLNGYVFKADGKPYRWQPKLNYIWRAACKRAGLLDTKLYGGTRHSFISQCVNAGAELLPLQQFVGHTDIQTTRKYAHVNEKGLKRIMELKQGKLVELREREER